MEELWKDIVGLEGLYEVSNIGNIRSVERIVVPVRRNGSYILKQKNIKKGSRNGYSNVVFNINGKHIGRYVHRLVGMAFIPNTKNYPQINHKNGIRNDNRVENLEWVTPSQNVKHGFECNGRKGPKPRLGKFGGLHNRSRKVVQMDKERNIIKIRESISEVTRDTGLQQSSISLCCSGKYKKSGGYIWEYFKI